MSQMSITIEPESITLPAPEVVRRQIAECRKRERLLEKVLQVSLLAAVPAVPQVANQVRREVASC
jgi:hypothetical protein